MQAVIFDMDGVILIQKQKGLSAGKRLHADMVSRILKYLLSLSGSK